MRFALLISLLFPALLFAQTKTSVVLLGTGNPRPSMTASGPAAAIVVSRVETEGKRGRGKEGMKGKQRGNGGSELWSNGATEQSVFLIDAGSGVERQLTGANLPINGVTAAFITHLHSDHTLGYPDLILTSWVMGRKTPLQVYGPHGLQAMTDHILAAWTEDIEIRTDGLEHEVKDGWMVEVHEVDTQSAKGQALSDKREAESAMRQAQNAKRRAPGAKRCCLRQAPSVVVYDSLGVRVTAIPVLHGSWKEAYAYRFDTPDRSIVISGDTRYCEALANASRGVDILVHEVHSASHLKPENRPGGADWPEYEHEFHTSDVELGKLAAIAKPRLLVLTHIGRMGATDEELVQGVRKGGFKGKVVVGEDLGRY